MREQIAAGRFVELRCEARLPGLQFVAGWLSTPGVGLVERVAEMAADVAEQHEMATRAEGRELQERRAKIASAGSRRQRCRLRAGAALLWSERARPRSYHVAPRFRRMHRTCPLLPSTPPVRLRTYRHRSMVGR